MFINKLLKAAAFGAGIYAVGKVGEGIGYCKGLVAGVRTAGHNPEWAVAEAAEFDRLHEQWKEATSKKA